MGTPKPPRVHQVTSPSADNVVSLELPPHYYIEKCTYVYIRACACERRVEPDEFVFVFVSSSVNNAPVYASLYCHWYTAVSEHLTAEL